MNITGLKYFVSVAQSKSITKAAQDLYITQPALSRHLQRLEDELGVRLFERERGKLTCSLTEAGKLCLRDAQQITRLADNMTDAVRTYISGEKGTLDIGYCGSEGLWLYEYVSQINKKFPDIEINARNLAVGRLEKILLEENLDLAYLDSRHCNTSSGELDFIELEKGRAQLLVSRNHPFAERGAVRLRELAQEKFITWPREAYPGFYDWFCDICRQHGFDLKIICYEETQMIYSAVYSGAGFSIYNSAHRRAVDPQLFSLVDVQMEDGSYLQGSSLLLAWKKTNSNPCLPTVLKLAREFVRERSEQDKTRSGTK